MTNSLFGGRYRYDYIYPRGRSGETLRAVDTHNNDRPVVIKRPAPNDAPPIRAGQEVSILNERKALNRLAGQPVLTGLVDSGHFFVGGVQHQYIVIERAQGDIVEETVLELARKGERLPRLEMLVIVDALLDLLQAAHEADIVYNDVDAKHLFWSRDAYRLKLIDWGNAIFLEGDEATAQGISRQSDIFQVAELLYFILTGGGRMDVPRDAGADFRLDFGPDAGRIPHRLQEIISRAGHPNRRLRYATVADLRNDLAGYREPLEGERDALVQQVNDRLRLDLSRDELQALLGILETAIEMDPGHPQARRAYDAILDRRLDVEVRASLDAVRIYMESANWERAVSLLDELSDKTGPATDTLVRLLLDCGLLLLDPPPGLPQDDGDTAVPPAIIDALMLLFDGQAGPAAQRLLTAEDAAGAARELEWLLAERISAHVPEVMLLRPNLQRLTTTLSNLAEEGYSLAEPRAVLDEINATLDEIAASEAVNLVDLRDRYSVVVNGLTALGTLLEAINSEYRLAERKLPLNALERAANAAMMLADNMHVAGKQAAASPRDALEALNTSRNIDPTNPIWDKIEQTLHALYEFLRSYQTYIPANDGSDVAEWLETTRAELEPFTGRLFDDMLESMVAGLERAAANWRAYAAATIQGDRNGAISALNEAANAVRTVSPTLAGWFDQLRNVVTAARFIERHARFGGLGRALADGWEAYDRGRLAEAEKLGKQAYDIARTDSERFASRRLRVLAETTRSWVERKSANDSERTRAALQTVEHLYTVDENRTRDHFVKQMPSNETFLRAMNRGLVDLYGRSNTAALRILFFNYILLSAGETQSDNLEAGEFWYEAALKVLEDHAKRHPATRNLDEYIQQRRDISAAARRLNEITGSQALESLESIRRALETNAQSRVLSAGIHSLRELEAAVRDWSDGEFRAAGIKLENAVNAIAEVEQAARIKLTPYRAWLVELQAAAADLYSKARSMNRIVDDAPDEPVAQLEQTHRYQMEATGRLLGETHAATLRQWHETYQAFCKIYADEALRRSKKLERFNERFRQMFIDRHPAYPLYRHWYTLVEASPEFPAPPTEQPLPEIEEAESDVDYAGTEATALVAQIPDEPDFSASRYADPPPGVFDNLQLPLLPLVAVGAVILVVVIVLFAVSAFSSDDDLPDVPITITDTPPPNLTGTAAAFAAPDQLPTDTPGALPTNTTVAGRNAAGAPVGDFATPTLRPTSAPATVLTETPSQTPTPTVSTTPTITATPTLTPTASTTPTPTETATPTNTPTATVPPQGLQGEHDILQMFARLPQLPWNPGQFAPDADGGFWRLGVGTETPGDVLSLTLPEDMLELFYGNRAVTRIRRFQTTLTVPTFNPALLDTGDVFFGALVQSADNANDRVGIEIRVAQPGVIDLNQRVGNDVSFVSRRAVNGVIVRIRLERNLANGEISPFVNGEQIGAPMAFVGPEDPILPLIFVKDGGVIVNITDWTVTFR